jgi:hypothetical protein
MLSKSSTRARRLSLAALLALSACSVPWRGERRDEINITFVLRNNQPIITADVENKRGTFVVSSAQPVSVVDPQFLQSVRADGNSRVSLTLGDRHSVQLAVAPIEVRPIADGILGADAWRGTTLTFDFRGHFIALSDRTLPMDDMVRSSFTSVPWFPIRIDGEIHQGIVDTALPDALLLPQSRFGKAGRRRVHATLAGVDFPSVDVTVGPTSEIRIGTRLLARFLVVIDYRQGVVGLWRDPRQ